MAQEPKYRLCQYPKASRNAAMVLASPAVPLQVFANPELAPGDYKVQGNRIEAQQPNIPGKILRDLTVNASLSVNDILTALKRDNDLEAKDPHLVEVISHMHTVMKDMAKAALDDVKVESKTIRDFGDLTARASNMSLDPAVADRECLGVPLKEFLPRLSGLFAEINNQALREQPELGRG